MEAANSLGEVLEGIHGDIIHSSFYGSGFNVTDDIIPDCDTKIEFDDDVFFTWFAIIFELFVEAFWILSNQVVLHLPQPLLIVSLQDWRNTINEL